MYPIEDLVYIPYVSNIRLSRYSMCIQQKSSIQNMSPIKDLKYLKPIILTQL